MRVHLGPMYAVWVALSLSCYSGFMWRKRCHAPCTVQVSLNQAPTLGRWICWLDQLVHWVTHWLLEKVSPVTSDRDDYARMCPRMHSCSPIDLHWYRIMADVISNIRCRFGKRQIRFEYLLRLKFTTLTFWMRFCKIQMHYIWVPAPTPKDFNKHLGS